MMEVTASSAFVDSLATTVILNFNFQVLVNLFFYSAAATTGVLTTSKIIAFLFQEAVKGLSYKWIARCEDRKELATAVIQICTEGSTTGWNIKPRDIEYTYFIARRLEGVDKKTTKLFDQCISSWSLNAIMQETKPVAMEDKKFCMELQKRAQDACEELTKIVNKWK